MICGILFDVVCYVWCVVYCMVCCMVCVVEFTALKNCIGDIISYSGANNTLWVHNINGSLLGSIASGPIDAMATDQQGKYTLRLSLNVFLCVSIKSRIIYNKNM